MQKRAGACPDPRFPPGYEGESLYESILQNKRLNTLFVLNLFILFGADSGNRTCDLFITSELLYQLSHVGASNNIDNPQSFIKKKLIVDP